ncbi:hypothetical protein C0993_005379 [Termitomyces sp. T159_Od127]|nr:hypothetical protein C0993_005379 [Termitomyces sp. T159_Od127]
MAIQRNSPIPAAAWFVLVSTSSRSLQSSISHYVLIAITTVGYGEITPRSFLGRLITLPILVFGLLLITLPSFVLGREFSIVWEQMTARQNQTELSMQIEEVRAALERQSEVMARLLEGRARDVERGDR